MKNPIRKSMLRSPLKTLLKLGIITLTLYFFISSVLKLIVVNTEIERIGANYSSIAFVDTVNEEDAIIKPELRRLIQNSEYVDFENILWYSQGISSGILNSDYELIDMYPSDDSFFIFSPEDDLYNGDFIYIGKLNEMIKMKDSIDGSEGLTLSTTIEKIISAYPEYGSEGDVKDLLAISHSPISDRPLTYITPEVIEELKGLDRNKYYLFRGYVDYRGVIDRTNVNINLRIKPLYQGGPLYYPVEDINSFSLEGEQWIKLRENIEILDVNRHTFMVHAIKDMSKLPTMQETSRAHFLAEGRWINIDDHNNKNKVCVIQSELAKRRGLKIGDKIAIRHRNLMSINGYIFSEDNRANWRDEKVSDLIEYEIVGMYTHILDTQGIGRKDEIYIPENSVPLDSSGVEKYLDKSTYTFVLKSSRHEEGFLDEYSDKIKELGYKVSFIDSNTKDFWNNAKSMRTASVNNTLVFGILLIIAVLFTLFLHFQDFKRIYAVERSLGIPKKTVRKHISNPILILVSIITAIIILFSRYDSIKTAKKQMAEIVTDIHVDTVIGISPVILVLIFTAILLVFIVILHLNIRSLEKKSIIELIQMGEVQAREKTEKEDSNELYQEEIDFVRISDLRDLSNLEREYENDGSKAVNVFIKRHILRSKIQTTLLVLLSLIFTLSVIWINQLIVMNRKQIDNAYKNAEIEADFYTSSQNRMVMGFGGDISERLIKDIDSIIPIKEAVKIGIAHYDSIYIKVNGTERLINEESKTKIDEQYNVYFSNNLIDAEGKLKLEDLNLEEGIEPSIFNTKWRRLKKDGDIHLLENENGENVIPILASNGALEKYGLSIGDEISFDIKYRRINRIYGKIVGNFEKVKVERLKNETKTPENIRPIFIVPKDVIAYSENQKLYYNFTKILFERENNKELYLKANELRELVQRHWDNRTSLQIKIWDEELQKVVGPLEKNLSLLEIVYPITLAISLLTAGFIAYIITLRKAKEMAILRVLGVSNREVKIISIKESLIPTVIGVTTGVILMLILRNSEYPVGAVGYLLAAGVYLIGTILGLWLALKSRDKKKPLELLQVKE